MGPMETMEPLCVQGINLMLKKKTDREKKGKNSLLHEPHLLHVPLPSMGPMVSMSSLTGGTYGLHC